MICDSEVSILFSWNYLFTNSWKTRNNNLINNRNEKSIKAVKGEKKILYASMPL